MKKVLLMSLGVFLSWSSIAQLASIKGTVKGGELNEGIPFATISVLEGGMGANSDFEGNFELSREAGTYHIILEAMNYKIDTVKVVLEAGETKMLDVKMLTEAEALDVFKFTVKRNKESEVAALNERKKSEGITTTQSAKELNKKGASNVQSGLVKSAGISVVGSNQLFVRGMGDRYNSVYLNGLPIASLDPDKKVIDLNLFPTSVVSMLAIDKAFRPNTYGDFSGGSINIQTRDYPSKPSLEVSTGVSINTITTGQDFVTNQNNHINYTGLDQLNYFTLEENSVSPTVNPANNNQEVQSAPVDGSWNPITRKAPVNSSFKIFGGNYKKLKKEDMAFGYLMSLSHSNSYSYQDGKISNINTQSAYHVNYDSKRYSTQAQSSALGSLFFKLNKQHQLKYNLLYLNQANEWTQELDGFHKEFNPDQIFTRRFSYNRNSLTINQLVGNHNFLDKRLKLSWAGSLNMAKGGEKDRRQLIWIYEPGDNEENYLLNARNANDNHRFFSELAENEYSGKVNAEYVLKQSEGDNPKDLWKMNVGAQKKVKKRFFDFSQYALDLNDIVLNFPQGTSIYNPDVHLNQANLNSGLYQIDELPNPASRYDAELGVTAFFAESSFSLGDNFKAIAGARYEKGYQFTLFRDQQQPVYLKKEVINSQDILPSFAVKFSKNDTTALRLSMSKTISRPSFREVAPFEYQENFGAGVVVGNPNLQNASIYNIDLRYEMYPRSGELIAVTGFYKQLDNPIEKVVIASAVSLLQTYNNIDKGSVAGVEFELTKKLDVLKEGKDFFDDFSFNTNLSLLYSSIAFDDISNGTITQTNLERPLQGASPYLANADLIYQRKINDNLNSTITLSYNIYGKRIVAVGTNGLGDAYELPVNSLNLISSFEVKKKMKIGLSVRNLLNPSTRVEQETDNLPVIINSYKRGVRVGLSLSYKFI